MKGDGLIVLFSLMPYYYCYYCEEEGDTMKGEGGAETMRFAQLIVAVGIGLGLLCCEVLGFLCEFSKECALLLPGVEDCC